MMQLINSIDSLISLHRSEGFGLHLAEAMAMEKSSHSHKLVRQH